jgi:hypothetical protein
MLHTGDMLQSLLDDLLPHKLLHFILLVFSVENAGTDSEQCEDTNNYSGVEASLLRHVRSLCSSLLLLLKKQCRVESLCHVCCTTVVIERSLLVF